MSKRIAILLTITDKPNAFSYATRTDNQGGLQIPGADQTYKIVISEQEAKGMKYATDPQEAMMDGAAHELGHVLSQVFATKAHQEDPRTRGEFRGMKCDHCEASPEQAARVYANEKEAWTIAEKIRPGMNPEAQQLPLKGYTKWGFNDPDGVELEKVFADAGIRRR